MQKFFEEITLKDAMSLAEVCQKTIYNWCEEGRFKYRRAVNRRLFIDKTSFFDFIENRINELNDSNDGRVGE